MTKVNMIGRAREMYYHSVGSKVSLIFGLSLTIYCVLVIHQRARTGYIDSIFVMTCLTLVLAVYILLDKDRNILRAMGLYSLGMALTRLPLAVIYILWPNPAIALAVGIFFLVIGINMLYSAWQYLHGICRGYIWSTIIIFFLWMVYSALLVAAVTGFLPDVTGTIFARVLDKEILAANVILFTVYLLVLGTDEIHDRCELEIAYDHAQTFRSINDAGYDSSISRDDARKIIAGPNTWKKVDVGPVESQLKFIVSYTDYALYGTAQKWKGDDRIFFTISESVWGTTMVEATRFWADKISFDGDDFEKCTHLRFSKNNGDFYSIEVLDDNMRVII